MANGTVRMRRCGTHQPSTGDRARIHDLEDRFFRTARLPEAQRQILVPVTFVHIVSGGNGHVTAQQRSDQIEAMNRAYRAHGITFGYDEEATVVVENDDFFTMGHRSLRERQCKRQHQAVEPQKGLNFYTAEPGGGLLGWATFPHEMEGDPEMDGVVMLHSTLPGGSAQNYNLGATAVHEVGHWLGLFHTFQDGCFELGDEVDDTPAHSGPNYGKPSDGEQPHNLCPTAPAGSLCPIHNYMNYVDDDWMTEFTTGQVERIWAQIAMFRTDLLSAKIAGAEMARVGAEAVVRVRW